jgi:hypothetical protein
MSAPLAAPPLVQPFTIDVLGRWSYAFCVALYVLLLLRLLWYFRCTFRFAVWRFYMTITVIVLFVLGFFFEWMADMFLVWDFPDGRHLTTLAVPLFGWFTGHRVPLEELVWIVSVVPLFYYLYLYSTLLFHDIIYVVDEEGRFYKREERWVGFTRATRITTRLKDHRGQENEVLVQMRPPGFIARWLGRHFTEPPPRAH